MQVRDLHTKRPPTQSDIYQIMYWYNWLSWWWALGCSKHVEKWNKRIKKCVKLIINTNCTEKHGQQNITYIISWACAWPSGRLKDVTFTENALYFPIVPLLMQYCVYRMVARAGPQKACCKIYLCEITTNVHWCQLAWRPQDNLSHTNQWLWHLYPTLKNCHSGFSAAVLSVLYEHSWRYDLEFLILF